MNGGEEIQWVTRPHVYPITHNWKSWVEERENNCWGEETTTVEYIKCLLLTKGHHRHLEYTRSPSCRRPKGRPSHTCLKHTTKDVRRWDARPVVVISLFSVRSFLYLLLTWVTVTLCKLDEKSLSREYSIDGGWWWSYGFRRWWQGTQDTHEEEKNRLVV